MVNGHRHQFGGRAFYDTLEYSGDAGAYTFYCAGGLVTNPEKSERLEKTELNDPELPSVKISWYTNPLSALSYNFVVEIKDAMEIEPPPEENEDPPVNNQVYYDIGVVV
jgi:hypothetical protein